MKYWKYINYILRHKYYVFLAFFYVSHRRVLGRTSVTLKAVLFWRIVIHDLTKFFPDEFFPYMNFFYGRRSLPQTGFNIQENFEDVEAQNRFDIAWLKHQHRNAHHHQYWLLKEDDGCTKVFPMPDIYLMEMLCDWEGASRAIRGKDANSREWYKSQWNKMVLHGDTRQTIDEYMGI